MYKNIKKVNPIINSKPLKQYSPHYYCLHPHYHTYQQNSSIFSRQHFLPITSYIVYEFWLTMIFEWTQLYYLYLNLYVLRYSLLILELDFYLYLYSYLYLYLILSISILLIISSCNLSSILLFSLLYPYSFSTISDPSQYVHESSLTSSTCTLVYYDQQPYHIYFIFRFSTLVIYQVEHYDQGFSYYSCFAYSLMNLYLFENLHEFEINFEYLIAYWRPRAGVNIRHLCMNPVVLRLLMLYVYFFGFVLNVINFTASAYCSLTLKLYHLLLLIINSYLFQPGFLTTYELLLFPVRSWSILSIDKIWLFASK